MLRTCTLTSLLLLAVTTAGAALPPRYQNAKDLEVMLDFVRQHEDVIATLKQIDLQHTVVHYGRDCEARFGRKLQLRPPGWVGPAAPLVFRNSTCPLD